MTTPKVDNDTLDAIIQERYFDVSALTLSREIGVSRSRVMRRIKALGLPSKKGHARSLAEPEYSEEDIGIMRRYAQTHTQAEVAKMIARSKDSVKKKSDRLGIVFQKRNNYSLQEDSFLELNYGIMSNHDIGVRINRTQESVRARAKLLGLTGQQNR